MLTAWTVMSLNPSASIRCAFVCLLASFGPLPCRHFATECQGGRPCCRQIVAPPQVLGGDTSPSLRHPAALLSRESREDRCQRTRGSRHAGAGPMMANWGIARRRCCHGDNCGNKRVAWPQTPTGRQGTTRPCPRTGLFAILAFHSQLPTPSKTCK